MAQPQKPVTRDEIIADIRRVLALLGTATLTREDYIRHGEIGRFTVVRVFGSFRAALEAAGPVATATKSLPTSPPLRRIAKGMHRFFLDAAEPFIVPIANWSQDATQSAADPLRNVTAWPSGGSFAVASPIIAPATHQGSDRVNDPLQPLPTVTCANRGEQMLVSPTLVSVGYGERNGQEPRVPGLDTPLGTVVAGGIKHAVAAAHLVKFRYDSAGAAADEPTPTITSGGNCQRPAGAAHAMGIATAFIEQANGGFNATPAQSAERPMTTVTNSGSQQRLAVASLATLRRNCTGQPITGQVPAITAGAEHHALVEYQLAPEVEAGAL